MKVLITELIWPEGLEELEAVAGLTEEAQVNTSILVAREVTKVLRGQPSLCVVG